MHTHRTDIVIERAPPQSQYSTYTVSTQYLYMHTSGIHWKALLSVFVKQVFKLEIGFDALKVGSDCLL